MKQRTLQELVTVPAEADYVQHFQALSTVNLEIREHGATAHRLLRKAILEMDVGNYHAALDAARDAVEAKPDLLEARYQEGLALILLSFAKVGVLAGSQGMASPAARPRRLLVQALDAFSTVAAANPEDEEAAADMSALAAFLEDVVEDDALEAELRAMFEDA